MTDTLIQEIEALRVVPACPEAWEQMGGFRSERNNALDDVLAIIRKHAQSQIPVINAAMIMPLILSCCSYRRSDQEWYFSKGDVELIKQNIQAGLDELVLKGEPKSKISAIDDTAVALAQNAYNGAFVAAGKDIPPCHMGAMRAAISAYLHRPGMKRQAVEASSGPFLQNYADGVGGHYCIAIIKDNTVWYWNQSKWAAFGEVFDLTKEPAVAGKANA